MSTVQHKMSTEQHKMSTEQHKMSTEQHKSLQANYVAFNYVAISDVIGDAEQCPGLNEAWTDCGNFCSEKCPDGKVTACILMCQSGCFCKPNHKRNPNGICVPETECPKIGGICEVHNSELSQPKCNAPYEIFKEDGSPCTDTCHKHLVRCMEQHIPGCYCIDGYARDLETNQCRPYPCEECGANAEWVNCASSCDNHCDFVLKRDHCKINHIRCPDGCRCKEGYARATSEPNSTCIPVNECV
uniref:CSON014544 protein n=1 Tax=Culicoides sonorensis TaxID=179676 RepID=A0A336LS86_CULSO